MIAVLDKAGVDTDHLLRAQGLERRGLADPYAMTPLRAYVAAMEAAAVAMDDTCFGARLGGTAEPNALGPIGILFVTAPTLRVALTKFIHYLETLQGGTLMQIVETAQRVHVDYRIEVASIWPRGQDAEFSLAALCTIVRSALGPAWVPRAVEFEHPAAGRLAALRRLFGAPIRFGCARNRLVLRGGELDQALGTGDGQWAPFVERHLRDLQAELPKPETLIDEIERVIVVELSNPALSVPYVAKCLGLSPRSLQRRLEAHGTSLRVLLRRKRVEAATALIEGGRLPLQAVAEHLGYRDAFVLSRAYRTWTGCSPREARRLGNSDR